MRINGDHIDVYRDDQPSPYRPIPAPRKTTFRSSRHTEVVEKTAPITSPDVAAVFDSYPDAARSELLALRQLILDTADETDGVCAVEETLHWGQPSYLTGETRIGSRSESLPPDPSQDSTTPCSSSATRIRWGRAKNSLVNRFIYDGNRALLFTIGS